MAETTPTPEVTTETSTKSSTFNIVTLVAIGLFIVSVAGNIWLLNKNKMYKTYITNVKKESELIEKEKSGLQDKVTVLTDQKATLDRSLSVAFNNMAAKDVVIDRLNKENTTLNEIKTQVGEIEKIRTSMSGQLDKLTASKEQLKKIQDNVNKTILTKQTQNQKIKEKLK